MFDIYLLGRNCLDFVFVLKSLMFAIKPEKEEISKSVLQEQHSLTDKLLSVYKKLKSIAKSEFDPKNKFKLAKLSQDKLNRIKNIESNMSCVLVAYEHDVDLLDKKINILNRINSLLNQYSAISAEPKIKDRNDDFSKFFE